MNEAGSNAENGAVKYLFVFRGGIPGILMPSVAYRRTKRHVVCGIKIVRCPFCNKPLTEIDKSATVEVYRYPARKRIVCHAYRKCQICKNEVGIRLV